MTTITTHRWKIGASYLEAEQHRLQTLIDILDLIKQAEERYAEHIRYAQSPVCQDFFPELRPKAVHQADISKRAAIRLKQYYNNSLNEMSL